MPKAAAGDDGPNSSCDKSKGDVGVNLAAPFLTMKIRGTDALRNANILAFGNPTSFAEKVDEFAACVVLIQLAFSYSWWAS